MIDEARRREGYAQISRERAVYVLFRLSILGKGLLSALEILGGILILLIPPGTIIALANFLTQGELSEEKYDFIATHIEMLAHEFVTSTTFLSIYLLSRGIIKLFLVAALLLNKLWAYPFSIAVLGLFILYQIYQMAVDYSMLLLLLTLFDFIVIYLIWNEWRIVVRHGGRVVRA